MLPGAVRLFRVSTLNGAGGNEAATIRRGMIVSYCLGWLKPYENQWLAYPPPIARRFAPELAALVGYRQHRPNLGNYEGRCPSILLNDEERRGPLGAIDALRPDPTALIEIGRQACGERVWQYVVIWVVLETFKHKNK